MKRARQGRADGKQLADLFSVQRKEILNRGYKTPWPCISKRMWLDILIGNRRARHTLHRTYWISYDHLGKRIFVKVYCGYRESGQESYLGRKEVILARYFGRETSKKNYESANVIDHWCGRLGYYVVFEWVSISTKSIEDISLPQSIEWINNYANLLDGLDIPKWYNPLLEECQYIKTREQNQGLRKVEAFNVDALFNIGMLREGRWFLHDYEKIQWGPKGLQRVYSYVELLYYITRAKYSKTQHGLLIEEIKGSFKHRSILETALCTLNSILLRRNERRQDVVNYINWISEQLGMTLSTSNGYRT